MDLYIQIYGQLYLLPHRKGTVSVTKTTRTIPLREIISGYSEERTKQVNTLYGKNAVFFDVEAGGEYSCQFFLKNYKEKA
jgi:hypothetical protein